MSERYRVWRNALAGVGVIRGAVRGLCVRRNRVLACAALVVGFSLARSAAAQGDDVPARGLRYAAAGADAATDTLAPPVPREFRAVWVATVSNLDWPSRPGLSTEQQQRELLAILDRAAAVHLNAIIFQVRPAGDALYASKLEPWSYFLTGRQGRAPEPYYDPLAFAITEAHRRGMELHAWFNPYRARHPDDTSRTSSPMHLSRTNPSLVHKYGPYQWMDPGEAEVRRRTTEVILDVVKRYDIDGVHIDDYFYPYQERARRGGVIPFPDDRSWAAYKAKGGTLARDDWRRQNVDVLIEELYTAIKRTKPWVKFGISPFGIWRPGSPPSVSGLDAYLTLYADSRKWLNEGWLDYFTPQLYWRLDAPRQSYADLLAWWRVQNTRERHIWPGNYTGRVSARRRPPWKVSELFDQIQETRAQLSPSSGNVHFSMDAFMVNTDSMDERLAAGLYAEPALVPPSPWLANGLPDPPVVVRVPQPRSFELSVSPLNALPASPLSDPTKPSAPNAARAPVAAARDAEWWLIRARYLDGWYARLVPATQGTIRLPLDMTDALPTVVYVSAVDRTGQESPSAVVR